MKFTTIITLTIAAAIAMGCRSNGNKNQDSANEPNVINYDDSTETTENSIPEEEIIPCDADDLAKFLAGKDDTKYATLQSSEYYKNYSANVQQTWKDLQKRTLNRLVHR